MYQCPVCPNTYPKLISLSLHFRKTHKKTARELCVLLDHDGVEPTCKCGCGSQVKFLDISRGFSDYVRGHMARVPGKNNFGKGFEKSLETRREMWKTGELQTWNKGLTKETDERVAINGLHGSETIQGNPEELSKRSERMKSNRLNGIIPTLHGVNHSQWKGGFSSLLAVCHSNRRLFQEWKYPKLTSSGFACEFCGRNREKEPRPNLEVHHNKVQMATIVRLIAEEMGWTDYYALAPSTDEATQELKTQIAAKVADYHIQNNVSGIVLCKDCHKKQHSKHNL